VGNQNDPSQDELKPSVEISCGLPFDRPEKIQMAHGGGGRMMQQLIRDVFSKAFRNPLLDTEHDSAVFPVREGRMAFTTDTYVVRPLFFPGGDIGKLAVYGTVNDLVMSGARPLYLSVGMILEEGFAIRELESIVQSMKAAAGHCGIAIVTGDTKVVERGKGDGIFINTAGVGVVSHSLEIQPQAVREGDAVLLSGDLGRHGIAIMAAREGLEFETTIQSDCAPLATLVQDLLESGVEVHCLRDLTRGGLASALNEIASKAALAIAVEEARIPVQSEVRGACEMLGLDPLYVANEGRLVAFVPEEQAEKALGIMRRHECSAGAARIGQVHAAPQGRVAVKSSIGVSRILDLLSGEQLPRIC
jgi:hydrogenase expression/formation protein HypE